MDDLKIHTRINPISRREILRKLDRLEKRDRGKVERRAYREGAKIVLAEVRARAPEWSGILKRSFHLRAQKGRGRGASPGYVVQSGDRAEFEAKQNRRLGRKGGQYHYGWAQEYGWRPGSRRKNNRRAKVPGRPWVRKSLRDRRELVLRTVQRWLLRGYVSITRTGKIT